MQFFFSIIQNNAPKYSDDLSKLNSDKLSNEKQNNEIHSSKHYKSSNR